MSERVLATDRAVEAARRMRQILDGDLASSIEAVRSCGIMLSNPAVWDGPVARDFRSTWPRRRQAIEGTLTRVRAMQGRALAINEAIRRAGTEGILAAGGTGGSGSHGSPLHLAPVVYDGAHLALWSYYRAARATWNRPPTLLDHFQRHWMDVRAASRDAYANAATRFLQDAKAAGYEVKVAGNTLRVWDPATRTFAAYTLDGKTRTIFRPDPALHPGDSYWHNPSFGHPPAGTELEDAVGGAARALDDAAQSPAAKLGRLLDTPAGRTLNRGLGALAVAGDVWTIASPSPNALGGANVERGMAAANLGAMALTAGPVSGLLAANAATDWIPGVGEVVMAGTALYFAGDLIYENREAIGHALSSGEHAVVHVASDIGHGLASGASHAWHSLFG